VDLRLTYLGSVNIMLELEKAEFAYDAVWPANSLWVSLGDRERRVKYLKSIMTSLVVFGVRRGKAEQLGFVGKTVRVRDLLGAIRERKLSFMMTSATQSNSGASAYLGFLYALAGNPEVLSSADLRSEPLKRDIRDLLSGINRTSGSSGWLKDLFLASDYDAMVNHESVVIEAN
jgi:Ca-activated chloride channel family protein